MSVNQEDTPSAGFQALDDDGDLTDMLGELRVLLPTAQLLSAFLIAVPFAPGFPRRPAPGYRPSSVSCATVRRHSRSRCRRPAA